MTHTFYVIVNRNGRYVTANKSYTSKIIRAEFFTSRELAEQSACLKYEERVVEVTLQENYSAK